MHLYDSIPESWKQGLHGTIGPDRLSRVLQDIERQLRDEIRHGCILCPHQDLIFHALNLTPLDQVRVVILGQDPYPNPDHAHGLAFSVPQHVYPIPSSLRNILRVARNCTEGEVQGPGDLSPWARQGVLLLNSVLTVSQGKPNAHRSFGWQELTGAILGLVAKHRPSACFLLWGGASHKLVKRIPGLAQENLFHSSHPSSRGANRGCGGHPSFNTSAPFSWANKHLEKNTLPAIDWSLS